MGRPLPNDIIGNVTLAGQQLQVFGILDEDIGIEELFIEKQRSPQSFNCAAVADATRKGRIFLQQNEPSLVGQGRILVEGFGAADAASGNATLNVNSVISIDSAGTGYQVGDSLTVPGTFTGNAATLTVDSVDVGGEILTVSIDDAGSGYTVIEANPISVTLGSGTGAEISINWQVDGIVLVDGGEGYTTAPDVTITGGGGTGALATAVLTGDEVSSFTIDDGGDGFTGFPNVEVLGTDQETVRSLHIHIVKTFEGNIYKYDIDESADEEGEATVDAR